MTKKVRQTPPSGWRIPEATESSEDRDLAALKRRKTERDQDDTPVEAFEDDDVTKPHQVMARSDPRLHRDMAAVIDRYETDPAFRGLWNIIRRQRKESAGSMTSVADAALKAAAAADASPSRELLTRIDKVEEQLHRLDSVLKLVKWILGIAVSAALGSFVTIGLKIYSEGYEKGVLIDRVDHIEKALERMRSSPAAPFLDLNKAEEKKP